MNTEEVAERIKAIIDEASERGIDVFTYRGKLWVANAEDPLDQGECIAL